MVEAFKIIGGKNLSGEIIVGGSKNSALPILTATLMEKGTYILHNVPSLMDIRTLLSILKSLGLTSEKIGENSYKIINDGLTNLEASYELVKKMRASFLVMGGMLAHSKKAKVSLPGGCAIGSRPVDLHLKGFESLGVKIDIEHGYVDAFADELIGSEIALDFPSVGATENIVMAATKAKGTTKLINAAKEPEISDLCDFLNKMGAKITGAGTSTITIEGVEKLTPCEHTIIPDRIAAGTYIIGSILFDGGIVINGVVKDHMSSFLSKLEEMGAKFEITDNKLKVLSKLSDMKQAKVTTMPYPGFPTDLQSPMMSLMALIDGGVSEMKETIFENRFMHVPELNRMGCKIDLDFSTAKITGVKKLSSASVMASDLRAGAALILAALKAEGTSIINRIYHVDRGYDGFVDKFLNLGASIERIKVEA